MALSVLVALMMLAVPLASSSNLFVDGGQTNSNGDAPLSAPSEGYTITFHLNGDKNSLDGINYASVSNPSNWHVNENGDLYTVVSKNANLSTVFSDLYTTGTSNIYKEGYTLDAWKDDATGAVYGSDASGEIKSDMTFSAVWLVRDDYKELNVTVIVDGETKEYVKVFPKYSSDNQDIIDEKNVYITATGTFIEKGISDLSTYGIIVNADVTKDPAEKKIDEVYSFKTTYGDDKEIAKNAVDLKVPITSKLTMTYTFDDKKFSKIEVNSIAFDKEIFKDGMVTLYASKLRAYTYVDVYNALADQTLTDAGKKLTYDVPILTVDANFVTADGYKLTGWNEGDALLQSEKEASSPLTLDAELNGYYVIFMVNGQFEYVYVPFGDLSADKTTLDITGVNHWVWMKYDVAESTDDYKGGKFTSGGSGTINSFNFASTTNIKSIENEAKDKGKTPAAVLIACFTPSSSTSYAVFDASSYTYAKTNAESSLKVNPIDDQTIKGTFGNEYVQYLIIPGKSGDKISVPSIKPVYDEDSKVLFISWNKYPAVTGIQMGSDYPVIVTAYSEKDVYGKDIAQYSANAVKYDYTITFYDGDEVVGTFYYDTIPTTNITSGLVAFEIDGKAYEAIPGDDGLVLTEEAGKAYENILVPDKDGYYITQWNDADNNKDIEFKWADGKISSIKVDIKDMKDDLNLYAQFKAEKYDIVYTNTYGNVGSMSQTASVDETVKLYSDSTFVYDGYKLTGWSDRPDGNGTNYDLGASFTLNGEQYEDLKDGKVTLYAVWEKLGSGSGTGGNTGGDNDNTALYLIAGMLAVIAILAIVGILLMRRK